MLQMTGLMLPTSQRRGPRDEYLAALRAGDRGDFKPLMELVARFSAPPKEQSARKLGNEGVVYGLMGVVGARTNFHRRSDRSRVSVPGPLPSGLIQ